MAGLPKSIIKKYGITKKAWQVYRGNKQKKRKSNKPKTRSSNRRTTTGKKNRSRRRSFLSYQTLGKFIRIGALIAPAIYAQSTRQTLHEKVSQVLEVYTGFNIVTGAFRWEALAQGWMPFIMSSLIINGVGKLNGIIRRL